MGGTQIVQRDISYHIMSCSVINQCKMITMGILSSKVSIAHRLAGHRSACGNLFVFESLL